MASLAISVECTPTDAKGRKGTTLKKTVYLDPTTKILDATRILLDKFGLTHEKDAASYALCIRKDSEKEKTTKFVIPDASRSVGSTLSPKVLFLQLCLMWHTN